MSHYPDVYLGKDAKLYWNAEWFDTAPSYYLNPDWREACEVRDLTMLGTRREREVSIWGHDYHATETSLENVTISFEYLYGRNVKGTEDEFQKVLRQSWMIGRKFEVLLTDLNRSDADAEGLRTAVQCAKFEKYEPLRGVQMLRIALRQTWYPDGPQADQYWTPVWWYSTPPT